MKKSMITVLAVSLCCCSMAMSQNLLTNGDFSDGLNGWTTLADGNGPTFGVVDGAGRITKSLDGNSDYSTGVIYQVINVAAGTHVQLSGSWAGDLSGAGGSWWSELAVFSLPTTYPLADNPVNAPYNFISGTTYAGDKTTFIGACFDYPGNFGNFDASGGTYAAASSYINSFGNLANPTWSTQDITASLYDWQATKTAMGAKWTDLQRQGYNVTDVVSNGQVVVALKFGSKFNDDGWVSFDNISLSQVPEPATITLIATGIIASVIRRRKK